MGVFSLGIIPSMSYRAPPLRSLIMVGAVVVVAVVAVAILVEAVVSCCIASRGYLSKLISP